MRSLKNTSHNAHKGCFETENLLKYFLIKHPLYCNKDMATWRLRHERAKLQGNRVLIVVKGQNSQVASRISLEIFELSSLAKTTENHLLKWTPFTIALWHP